MYFCIFLLWNDTSSEKFRKLMSHAVINYEKPNPMTITRFKKLHLACLWGPPTPQPRPLPTTISLFPPQAAQMFMIITSLLSLPSQHHLQTLSFSLACFCFYNGLFWWTKVLNFNAIQVVQHFLWWPVLFMSSLRSPCWPEVLKAACITS